MARIYNEKTEIDTGSVKKFFDTRAQNVENPLNAVMLQSAESSLSQQRDAHEREHLLPKPEKKSRIIDLACGAGRLAAHYAPAGHSFLGVDFSAPLLEKARILFKDYPDVAFAQAELPKLPAGVDGPFDLVIVTGLMIYLNDDAVREMLVQMERLAARDGVIYFRDSFSDTSDRLTLKDFYSEELKDAYNAIYRPLSDFHALFAEIMAPKGWEIAASGYAYPPELRNRSETAQHYFRFERKK